MGASSRPSRAMADARASVPAGGDSRAGDRRSKTLVGMAQPFVEHERRSHPMSISSFPPPADGTIGGAKSDSSGLRSTLVESRAQLALLTSMLSATSDGMILADLNGIVALWNDSASKIFEIEEADAVGDSLFRILEEASEEEHADIVNALRNAGKAEAMRAQITGRQGGRVYALVSLNYVLDPEGKRVGIVAAIKDNTVVERLTRTDALTGIPNRREFDELIGKAYSNLGRGIGGPLSLIFLDVDDFKAFNTRYGHQVADEVLRAVGSVLDRGTRAVDAPARLTSSRPGRYGGEEFVVILPGTDAEGAMQVAERLRKKVADIRIELEGTSEILWVTASFGIATHSYDDAVAKTAKDLIAQANGSMQEAKKAGKNRSIAFGKVT